LPVACRIVLPVAFGKVLPVACGKVLPVACGMLVGRMLDIDRDYSNRIGSWSEDAKGFKWSFVAIICGKLDVDGRWS
jgi:hypothetical protein